MPEQKVKAGHFDVGKMTQKLIAYIATSLGLPQKLWHFYNLHKYIYQN